MGGEAANDAKSLEDRHDALSVARPHQAGARGAKAEIHLAAKSAMRRRRSSRGATSMAGHALMRRPAPFGPSPPEWDVFLRDDRILLHRRRPKMGCCLKEKRWGMSVESRSHRVTRRPT
jgi:hypothetical protein